MTESMGGHHQDTSSEYLKSYFTRIISTFLPKNDRKLAVWFDVQALGHENAKVECALIFTLRKGTSYTILLGFSNLPRILH